LVNLTLPPSPEAQAQCIKRFINLHYYKIIVVVFVVIINIIIITIIFIVIDIIISIIAIIVCNSNWTEWITVRNSDWTEWSAIQAVIGRVISKSAEREAQGRFGIASTIASWIVRHEIQLLINHNYNKIREEYDSGLNYLTGLYI